MIPSLLPAIVLHFATANSKLNQVWLEMSPGFFTFSDSVQSVQPFSRSDLLFQLPRRCIL